ncbi:MAG: cyclic nucleotide-binding domain-containing protein [SAR324 cluster bacterium]|nr:cyclic nucleotide-binding domain-containing protein [SAR324 cluster bacterium]
MQLQKIFILQTCPAFSSIPGNLLSNMIPYLEEENYAEGEIIFKSGDVVQSMYIVIEGMVHLNKQGQNPVVVNRREIFGELAALSTEIMPYTAIAMEETHVFRLEQDDLYELMSEEPELARILLRTLTSKYMEHV